MAQQHPLKMVWTPIACTAIVIALLFVGCRQTNSSKDDLFPTEILKRAEIDLKKKNEHLSLKIDPFKEIEKETLSPDERNAMLFLYAYMPLPDIYDHTPEYHLKNVQTSLKGRVELPWGEMVPADLFRHFVLPVRTNNEFLDDFRTTYYEELRDLVKNMSMEQAVLELNHWSHKHITYAPSDGRTRPPMATLKNALGRCGEQSTFVVAVLRTAGIPARQVYTPRWAHTDDNHAWVEAWVDGKWHYLGASEPAPVLNNAWFDAPVLRAMLLHTTAFGHYTGSEEWLGENPVYTELNVTDNYVPIAPARVRVLNPDGSPAEGAEVTFRLYNYVELYPLVTRIANPQGDASAHLGLGDIVVYASLNGRMAMSKMSVRPDADTLILTLGEWDNLPKEQHLTLVPPAEQTPTPKYTPEQEEKNNERLAQNNASRNAYTASFFNLETAQAFIDSLALSSEKERKLTSNFLVQSRGNKATISTFIAEAHQKGSLTKALSLLGTLMNKDLEDVSLEVLRDALNRDLSAKEWKDPYIISPRVSLETLYPIQQRVHQVISEWGAEAPKLINGTREEKVHILLQKMKQLRVDDTYNPRHLSTNPLTTLNLKLGDRRNLILLFVRLLREAKVPAFYDPANQVILYINSKEKATIIPFLTEADLSSEPSADCALNLSYKYPHQYLKKPLYSKHFSVSYIDDLGKMGLYEFDWEDDLSKISGQKVIYPHNLLSTGTREANGTVHLMMHKLECGSPTELTFDFNEEGVNVIGNLDAESIYYDKATHQKKSILSTTGRGYYLLVLAKPNHEPSDHILRDLKQLQKDGKFPIPTIALTKGETSEELKAILPTITWGEDTDGIMEKIANGTEQTAPLTYPVVVVSDTFNRLVFINQGYTIGIGDRLEQVLSTLAGKEPIAEHCSTSACH